MAKSAAPKAIEEISRALPHLIRLPAARATIDYDRVADVLYVSLKHPQRATETREILGEGILLRYRGDELVGVTILNASRRGNGKRPAHPTPHPRSVRGRPKKPVHLSS